MKYIETIIEDFADYADLPEPVKPVQKPAIKPTVFKKPKYPVEDVKKRLDELLSKRADIVGQLAKNTENIKRLNEYLEAVEIG
jgi:hypothetical protein